MSSTGLIFDERFTRHVTAPGHPERPQRIQAVRRALISTGLDHRCDVCSPEPASVESVAAIHDAVYVDNLRRRIEGGAEVLDGGDTTACPESFDIAQLAAGAVIQAADRVMAGRWKNAFCAVRPPGHHAEHNRAMGFCLLNNVAIAAQHLVKHHGLERILILDWDVHHGNGTQHAFEERSDIYYMSLHGHPRYLFPGTGWPEENGRGQGKGYTLNVCFEPYAGDSDFRQAFETSILPAIDPYRPQIILLSAGFDAHRLDPLAPLNAEQETFDWMGEQLLDRADAHCGGRLVSVLEGGYHLDALADCCASHVEGLLRRTQA